MTSEDSQGASTLLVRISRALHQQVHAGYQRYQKGNVAANGLVSMEEHIAGLGQESKDHSSSYSSSSLG
jgi:hypothetical protein